MQKLSQGFSETPQELWNNWEIRVLVLVSLTLQLYLLHFGSRRRYSVKTWLRVSLWLAFLGADSVATIALGVISNKLGCSCDSNDSQLQNELMAFWAPFLLLHLGGQDTITAYAVQDNELWLRHLLGLVVQSGVALYILLLSWKVSWLSFLTIAMFLAGFIKYAERTWALKSASHPNPRSISITGLFACYMSEDRDSYMELQREVVLPGRSDGKDSFELFEIFSCLFFDLKVIAYSCFSGGFANFSNSQSVWKGIEDELGYAYDFFYTKVPLFFTAWGFLFRLFSFTSILFVFVLFLIIERHKHPLIDLIITYLLLVGAILIEIYAVILLSASDWPWSEFGNRLLVNRIETLFTPIRNGCAKLTSKQRWSNSMAQLNLLSLCLKDKSPQVGHRTPKLFDNLREWAFNQMLPKLNGELEMHLYRTHKQVSDGLKDFVFNTFREKLRPNSIGFSEEYDKYITTGTVNVETHKSIIIWHIATDLCFYKDSDRNEPNLSREVSKDVSDYMMYILVMCPFVLSAGNATLVFEGTCALFKEFIQMEKLSRLPKAQVCEMLISEYNASSNAVDYSSLGGSLISSAILLAKKLNRKDGKWETLSKFWVENLAYVSTLCKGNNHAQLLRTGGEFLTHVWLLIEHFNLSQSFQKTGTRPQEEEAEVSPGSEIGGSATGSVFESGYGQGSGNGSAIVSGAYELC